MQASAKAAEAFDRVVEFLESFEPLEDHRQRAKVLYPLDEVLLLVLLGVLAGCEGWVEIEKFGEAKLNLLRRFHAAVGLGFRKLAQHRWGAILAYIQRRHHALPRIIEVREAKYGRIGNRSPATRVGQSIGRYNAFAA
jgi:hypothetical protein